MTTEPDRFVSIEQLSAFAQASSFSAIEGGWFRAVADFTYDWESWHGPDGRLLWVNPAVERITGYSIAECLAMSDYPLHLVASEDRTRIAAALVSARERSSGENVEFRCAHRSGESRWMSLAWQPMFGAQQEYLGFRTSVRDMTDRHRLREELRLHAEHLEQLVQERTIRLRQLEQRQRQMEKLAALGQLAAGVAHEINNPLAGMRNAFQLIKSTLPPNHEHFDLLELIDREIDRISGIIHQMYQLYRRTPQQASVFDMVKVICEVQCMLTTIAAKRNITLSCDAPDRPVTVLLVQGEVKQILYNLIRNAIQASPPMGEVLVRIKQKDHEVAVEVEDRGAGIPADIMPLIFDPFFSTKQGESQLGMGLGLSVSRSLIEALGGRIEVDSEVGRGSSFVAFFPHHPTKPQDRADD